MLKYARINGRGPRFAGLNQYFTFDLAPEISYPDRVAGTTYAHDFDTQDSWTINGATTLDMLTTPGAMRVNWGGTVTGTANYVIRNGIPSFNSNNVTTFRARIRRIAGSETSFRLYNVVLAANVAIGTYSAATGDWETVTLVPTAAWLAFVGSATSIRAFVNGASSGDVWEIQWIYLGDGTYSWTEGDLSGSDNSLTPYGGLARESGVVGYGLRMDGLAGYLSGTMDGFTDKLWLHLWENFDVFGATAKNVFESSVNQTLTTGAIRVDGVRSGSEDRVRIRVKTATGTLGGYYALPSIGPKTLDVLYDKSVASALALRLFVDAAEVTLTYDFPYSGAGALPELYNGPYYVHARAGSSLFSNGAVDEIALFSSLPAAGDLAAMFGLGYPMVNNYELREQAGASSVSRVEIHLEGLDTPDAMDEISLYDTDNQLVFSGICGIPESVSYSTGFEPETVVLQVQSLNAVLRRRTVNAAWQDVTITQIVQDVYDDYIAAEGFELGTISVIEVEIQAYVAGRLFIGDVLDELATKAGATWNIDSVTREFSFVVRADFAQVPAKAHISRVKRSVSAKDLRTRQIIIGGTDVTSEQTEGITWVSGSSSLTVGYPVNGVNSATIDALPVGVGVSGYDDYDVTKTFLWSYNSNTIKVNPLATVQPAGGDVVEIKYTGIFSIEISSDNADKVTALAARTRTSGIVEDVDTDASIRTTTDGVNQANALLDKYGDPNTTITLEVDSPDDTAILTTWTFALAAQHIEGDFVIVERSRRFLTVDRDLFSLKLCDKNFYMKYGASFVTYDKTLTAISIRGDEVIVETLQTLELLGLTEDWGVSEGDTVQFPGVEPGPVLDSFYPTEV